MPKIEGPDQRPHERRLSRAVLTDEEPELAESTSERNVLEHCLSAIADQGVDEFECNVGQAIIGAGFRPAIVANTVGG